MDKKTAFYIMGLQNNATQEDVKKRFKLLAKKIHPDMPNGDQELYIVINEVYKYILDNCFEEERENIVIKKRRDMQNKEQFHAAVNKQESKATRPNDFEPKYNYNHTNVSYRPNEFHREEKNKTEPKIKYSETSFNVGNSNTKGNPEVEHIEKNNDNYEKIIKERRNKIKSSYKKDISEVEPILTKEDIKDFSPATIIIGNNILSSENKDTGYTIENIYDEILENDFKIKYEEDFSQEKTNDTTSLKIYFTLKELRYLAKYGFVEKKAIKGNTEKRVRFLATEVFSNFGRIYYLKDIVKIHTKNKIVKIPFETIISPYSIMATIQYKSEEGKQKIIVVVDEHKQAHIINKNSKFGCSSFIFEFKLDDVQKYFETFAGVFLTVEII